MIEANITLVQELRAQAAEQAEQQKKQLRQQLEAAGTIGSTAGGLAVAMADPAAAFDAVIAALKKSWADNKALPPQEVAKQFLDLSDVNTDGKISRPEFEAGVQEFMKKELLKKHNDVERAIVEQTKQKVEGACK
eukprot:TRINITY_DN5074_c0_g1_i1.p1 TRINITY_DN5074_c0_g1~~TRINITY_DN5074_c0_g1_i1.p1  ORF type:complete len:135 (+),score=56.16 TRINITY_DN5074_c0_g1_i1:366-770(+)